MDTNGRYVLDDDNNPVLCPDLLAWGRWMENADRTVKADRVGDSRVSTVFLGLDHRFGDGPPVLFETMVFDGPLSDECDRYSTRQEAIDGHAEMVDRCKALTKAKP